MLYGKNRGFFSRLALSNWMYKIICKQINISNINPVNWLCVTWLGRFSSAGLLQKQNWFAFHISGNGTAIFAKAACIVGFYSIYYYHCDHKELLWLLSCYVVCTSQVIISIFQGIYKGLPTYRYRVDTEIIASNLWTWIIK